MIRTTKRPGQVPPGDRAARLWQRRLAFGLSIRDVANRSTFIPAKTWWQIEDGDLEPADETAWLRAEAQLEAAIQRQKKTPIGATMVGPYWLGGQGRK